MPFSGLFGSRGRSEKRREPPPQTLATRLRELNRRTASTQQRLSAIRVRGQELVRDTNLLRTEQISEVDAWLQFVKDWEEMSKNDPIRSHEIARTVERLPISKMLEIRAELVRLVERGARLVGLCNEPHADTSVLDLQPKTATHDQTPSAGEELAKLLSSS